VGEIRSQGELAGEFDADVVQLSGTVKDSTIIRAKSLEVKLHPVEGKMQVVFGECSLEVGSDAPQPEVAGATGRTAPAVEPAKALALPPGADANGAG
jgi:hypothetical protein